MKTKSFSLAVLLPLFLLLVIPVSAIGRPDFAKKPETTPTEKATGKLRACQAWESSIKTRMSHLVSLAATMQEKFDKIAERVENYYINKTVPSGKTVTNYDTLVSDIQVKKEAVTAAVATAQTNADAFTCDSENPKDSVKQFRLDMQNVKKALKDYRTSIKNLIVAVRSVTGEENKDKDEPTVTPTVTVAPTP